MCVWGENNRLLYDTFLYANQHQIPGLLLMVDFEKAFDSVAWSFIEKSLRKFMFGKDITRWILTFYTNINSCVHMNGQYSQRFDVKRGTRQGDPLSPYLFLICAELLASVIRQNENIHGMNILDEEIFWHKICCHNLQMIQPFSWMVQENHFAHVCVSYSSLLQCLV